MMSALSDLHYLDIVELAALLRAREISSREITEAMLDRIARIDGSLHSYASIMADRALRPNSSLNCSATRVHST